MDEKTATPLKIMTCVEHSPAGFKQQFTFVAYLHKHLAITLRTFVSNNPLFAIDPLLYLVGEIVDVHHRFIYPSRK